MSDLRPAYFCVQRLYGREVPAIFWDELPREPLRALVYVVRLDQLPRADELLRAPIDQLFQFYQRLKSRGQLPPRWEPPPRKEAQKAKILVGHRESPSAVVQRTRMVHPDE